VAIYDEWAAHYDVAEGDRSVFIDLYCGLLGPRIRSLLELGCGTGRITAALAQCMAQYTDGTADLRVTGLDESIEMLRVARARAPRIEWVLGDLRSPPLTGLYDFVVCCNNTLQLLLSEQDLVATFRAVRQLLAPEGVFAFDIYQPNLAYLSRAQTDRLVACVIDAQGRPLEVRENFVYDANSRILTVDRRLLPKANRAVSLTTIHYKLRQYFPADIDRLLRSAGLAVTERYGDFDRSAATQASKKQIVVCRGSDAA
jgi:SAM-dependent methyltransferase